MSEMSKREAIERLAQRIRNDAKKQGLDPSYESIKNRVRRGVETSEKRKKASR